MNNEIVDTSTNSVQDNAQADLTDSEKYEAYRVERHGKQAEEPVKVPEPEVTVAQDAKTEDKGKEAEPESRDKRPSGYRRLKDENDELKARLAAKEQEAANPPEKQAKRVDADKGPQIADYPNVEEWADARDEWKQDRKAAVDRLNAHATRMAKAEEAHGDDWHEALEALDRIKVFYPDTILSIQESDRSADILFHLGKHPKEAEAFKGLSPAQQLVRVGTIITKLESAEATQEAAKPVPKVAKAPPKPITPLAGGKSVGTAATDWMESEDFEVYRAGSKRAAEAARR